MFPNGVFERSGGRHIAERRPALGEDAEVAPTPLGHHVRVVATHVEHSTVA
jgi:hypothetical protein